MNGNGCGSVWPKTARCWIRQAPSSATSATNVMRLDAATRKWPTNSKSNSMPMGICKIVSSPNALGDETILQMPIGIEFDFELVGHFRVAASSRITFVAEVAELGACRIQQRAVFGHTDPQPFPFIVVSP